MKQKEIRIMIVEDEALIAEGLRCCVEKFGFQVAAMADNGPEAVQLALSLQPDCILMDINIPECDGITTLKKIREKREIPCIFLTGYSDKETISRAGAVGAYAYLTKPVDEHDLYAALVVALGRHRETVELHGELEQTRRKLEERKLIERAKGILMSKFDFDEQQAMTFLQKKSRNSNRKLAQVAQEILRMEDLNL